MLRKCFFILAVCGVFLLALNIAGVFVDHRPNELHRPGGEFADQLTLNYEQALAALDSTHNLHGLEKAARVNRIIAQATAHSNGVTGPAVQTKTPWTENWALRILGEVEPVFVSLGLPRGTFSFFHYQDPWRALERGVGMCGQLSVILSGVLFDMGMESGALQLNGHIVTYVREGGQEWIMDPDIDVVLPFGMDEVCDRVEEMQAAYLEAGMPRETTLLMEPVFCDGEPVYVQTGRGNSRPRLYLFEQGVYMLKWLFPLALLLPFMLTLRRK